MIVTHPKGRHESVPFILEITSKIGETYEFTEDSKYKQDDPVEQLDWLKLTGVTSSLFNAQKSSVMLAWRYNPTQDYFEIIPYWHDSSGTRHYDEKNIIPVELGETFTVYIELGKSSSLMRIVKGYRHYFHENIPVVKGLINRKINAWFGGTLPAPKTVRIKRIF